MFILKLLIVVTFALLCLFIIFGVPYIIWSIRREDRRIRRARNIHCLECGYDLRGIWKDCPECGYVPPLDEVREWRKRKTSDELITF